MPHRLKKLKSETRVRRLKHEALFDVEAGRKPFTALFDFARDDFDSLRERALGYVETGLFEEARAAIEILQALGDINPATDLLLAHACDRLGDRATAIRHFARGIGTAREATDVAMIDAAMEWGAHLATDVAEEVKR